MIILSFNYQNNLIDRYIYHLILLSFGYSLMIGKASPQFEFMLSLREWNYFSRVVIHFYSRTAFNLIGL